MNRRQKIIVSVTGIFLVLLILVGLTYAYFLTRIISNTNNKSISITTANLALKYDDGSGVLTIDKKIVPNTTISEKTFSVENTGDTIIDEYAVTIEDLKIYYANATKDVTAGTPTYLEYPETMQLMISCNEYNKTEYKTNPDTATSLGTCSGYNGAMPTTNDILLTNEIEAGIIQVYSLILKFMEAGFDQSLDMNKTLEGKINIIIPGDTMDLSGKFSNYEVGDYIQINSEPKQAYPDKDGNYKFIGVEPGVHTLNIYNVNDSDTSKATRTITIVKGETPGRKANTITFNETYRVLTASVNVSAGTYNLGTTPKGTAGNAASLLKVGDYVTYSPITNTYTTPEVLTGKSVYPSTQTFDSSKNGNAIINNADWRVISVDGNEVKLMPESIRKVTEKLKMSGANAYLNARTVLDEICSTLYSNNYGTARSISMEDIDKIVQHDGTVYYRNADGHVKVDRGTTIGDIENETGLRIQGDRLVPGGGNIEDLEINYYGYRLIYAGGDDPLTRDSVKNHIGQSGQSSDELILNIYYRMLLYYAHQDTNNNYWIANTMNDVYLYEGDEDGAYLVKYRLNMLNAKSYQISGKTIYNSNGVSEEAEYKVMPIVTLNKGVKITKDSIESTSIGDFDRWKILS